MVLAKSLFPINLTPPQRKCVSLLSAVNHHTVALTLIALLMGMVVISMSLLDAIQGTFTRQLVEMAFILLELIKPAFSVIRHNVVDVMKAGFIGLILQLLLLNVVISVGSSRK